MAEKWIFEPGDIVTLKKPHPCGSAEWELLRVGADFKLRCLGCGHQLMLPRAKVTAALRRVHRGADTQKQE